MTTEASSLCIVFSKRFSNTELVDTQRRAPQDAGEPPKTRKSEPSQDLINSNVIETQESIFFEKILQDLVHGILTKALNECNTPCHSQSTCISTVSIKSQVTFAASPPLSPSKRTRAQMLENQDSESSKMLAPLFKESLHIKTPKAKVDYTDPEMRHVWDKENWNIDKKCYSTDRKKKRVKGLQEVAEPKKRVPLADITLRPRLQKNQNESVSVATRQAQILESNPTGERNDHSSFCA